MQRIAVLTSGGDAPGMNAAIRAVVRSGLERGFEMFGVRHGYRGLIAGDFVRLGARDVGGIIQRGGTMLGSARCPEFKTEEGLCRALEQLGGNGIGGLVTIGGNGTQTGSHALSRKDFPVAGVASTIDNDLYGSEITIGVDTALNIALEAIDRLKVTASSHQRAFVVEVMGRDSGYIALMAGITGGAEAITVPEVDTDPEALGREIRSAYERGKPHALVVAAEGAHYEADRLSAHFKDRHLGFELRVVTWATCSAAATRPSPTGCWRHAWAPGRWTGWHAASTACWSDCAMAMSPPRRSATWSAARNSSTRNC
jgi:6-phosphofructokinase 1